MVDQPVYCCRGVPGRTATDDVVSVRRSGTVPIIHHVTAYSWRCSVCGWMGTGFTSDWDALKEASTHAWDDHQIAVCAPFDGTSPFTWDGHQVEANRPWLGSKHPGHVMEHVTGSNGIDQCARCGLGSTDGGRGHR